MLISAVSVTQTVQAHDYYKIKLKVQVVNPAAMNDTAIKGNIDRVNEIFHPCRIKFNVIVIERGVEGSAQNATSKKALLDKMKEDLSKKPFEGAGGGINHYRRD